MQEEKFSKTTEFNRGIIMQSLLREECGIKGFSDLANENVVILEQGSENISFLTKERKSNSFWIVDAVCDRGSAAKFSLRGINEDMFGNMCKLAKMSGTEDRDEDKELDLEDYLFEEAFRMYKESISEIAQIEALKLLAHMHEQDR